MSKGVDDRKIMALGYFNCPVLDTYGKKIKACIKAGYTESYASRYSGDILEINKFTDTMAAEWKKIQGMLPLCKEMLENWIVRHKDNPKSTDIRELNKTIHLIGDLQGKFIKRQESLIEKREKIVKINYPIGKCPKCGYTMDIMED